VSEIRFRNLERHRVGGTSDRMTLGVPVPRSLSGKAYQYSPNSDAVPRLFLIGDAPAERTIAPEHLGRIRRQPGPGETICPYSGYRASDREFIHFDDVEAVKRYIVWAAREDVHNWLVDTAQDFNRRQPRGGFITMSMDVKPSHNPKPLAIRGDLLRELRCDICQRAYGVYAIGLFCPDCGAPNLSRHFQREAELVQQQVTLADTQHDAPELAYRLMGNAHEDVLTAFEATLKTAYAYLVRMQPPEQADQRCIKKAIGNAFQNVQRARDLFAAIRIDPFNTLSADQTQILVVNIQKRHVIGHNLGIADEHYTELTQEEQPGETVRILGEEIRRFATICAKVIATLEDSLLPTHDDPTTTDALRPETSG
jgi:hypothetical protein